MAQLARFRATVALVEPLPDPTDWDAPTTPTLTVTVDEIMPGGRRFAPLDVGFRIRVFGSALGDTPDTSRGTVFGGDGDLNNPPAGFLEDTNAFQSHDPTFVGMEYVVHTGDTGFYRNERVGHISHRDKRYEYGQNPTHVYEEAKTYTNRRVYVYSRLGEWGRVDLPDLVVESPDVVFPPEATVVFSFDPNEDWTGAPNADPANRFRGPGALHAAAKRVAAIQSTLPLGDGIRLSGRPGTYNEFAARSDDFANPNNNFLFMPEFGRGRSLLDAWGTTGEVFVDERVMGRTRRTAMFRFDTWSWVLSRWHFHLGYDVNAGMPFGGWDNAGSMGLVFEWQPSLGAIPVYAGSANPLRDPVRGTRCLVHRVRVEGSTEAVIGNSSAESNARWAQVTVVDSIFLNNNEYGFVQGSNVAMLGLELPEVYGTELGAMGRNRVGGSQRGFKGHRGIRESAMWTIYIRASYFEARGGWSGLGGATAFGSQGIRIYTPAGVAHRLGRRVHICDSVFISNVMNIGREVVEDREFGWGGANNVIENCVWVADPGTRGDGAFIQGLQGNSILRNNVFIVPNVAPLISNANPLPAAFVGKDFSRFEAGGATRLGEFVRFGDYDYVARVVGREYHRLHNTYAMLRTDANVIGGDSFVLWPDLMSGGTGPGGATIAAQNAPDVYTAVVGHNVEYAPNVTTPRGPTMETIAMPSGVRVLDVWFKFVWERAPFTLPAPVGPGELTPLIPYPVDWYGNLTTGASYAGTGNNNSIQVNVTGGIYAVPMQLTYSGEPGSVARLGGMTVIHDLDADGNPAATPGTGTHFRVRNESQTETWESSAGAVILHRGTTSMEPDRLMDLDQNEDGFMRPVLYRPTTPQSLTNGVRSTLFDFTRTLRPNSGFAIAPSGTNAAGALLPA